MTQPPPTPRCLQDLATGEDAARRRLAWSAHVLRELRAQDLTAADRMVLLVTALAHEVATFAAGEEAEALAWLEFSLGVQVGVHAGAGAAGLGEAKAAGHA